MFPLPVKLYCFEQAKLNCCTERSTCQRINRHASSTLTLLEFNAYGSGQ